jgi:hypothetical protein
LERRYMQRSVEPRAEVKPDVRKAIRALIKAGETQLRNDDLPAAWESFGKAFALIPEPRDQDEDVVTALSGGAEAQFLAQHFVRALAMFLDCVNCAPDSPFLNCRVGQCWYELGEMERAAHHLTLAYMAEGREIFKGEDAKYFGLLERVLKPPKGMDRLP